MTLDQLRIFIAVAELEHVTRAAEQLHMTQSATSAAVGALEKRYGVQLFDRLKRRITLTSAGKIFLREAKSVTARAKVAESVLNELAGGNPTVRIAAAPRIGNYWLTTEICRFKESHPNIEIELILKNDADIVRCINEGLIDIGITEHKPECPELIVEFAHTEEFVLVSSCEYHKLNARRPTNPVWLVREVDSESRRLFEAALDGTGHPLGTIITLPSDESLKSAIACDMGIGMIPRSLIASDLSVGRMVQWPDSPVPTQTNYLVWSARRQHKSIAALCASISSSYPQLSPDYGKVS
jgi:DNA-binding transcriptional LysR family regulator